MKTRALVAMTLVAAAFGVGFAPTAAAHTHVPVGDYELTLGWEHEPPVVDQLNAFWLRVEKVTKHEEHADPEAFLSEVLASGESFSHTFATPGTFPYHCHLHPDMKGNVTVEPAHEGEAPATHQVAILDGDGGARFDPADLTIHAGDTVVWTNQGSLPHQVMADAAMDHEEGGGHTHGAEGGHESATSTAVEGAHEALNVTVSIGGQSKTLTLKASHGEPGVYTAMLIPTVPGIYTFHLTGNIDGTPVDVTEDLQEVVPLSAYQFPETTQSARDLQAEVDALKADAETKSNRNAPVKEDGNPTPFPGAALLVASLAVLALALRRRG